MLSAQNKQTNVSGKLFILKITVAISVILTSYEVLSETGILIMLF